MKECIKLGQKIKNKIVAAAIPSVTGGEDRPGWAALPAYRLPAAEQGRQENPCNADHERMA
jgi:hypothetical protein